MSSVGPKAPTSLFRSFLTILVVVGMGTQSFAISRGYELVSIGSGAASVSIGKAKNIKALRVVGWALITTGGTVTAGDAVLGSFSAAMLGAMMGAMWGSMFQLLNPLTYMRADNKTPATPNAGERTSLAEALTEVRSEVILASSQSINEDKNSVIDSVAKVLGVETAAFASDFRGYMRTLDQDKNSRAEIVIRSTNDPEKLKVIKGIFKNYQRAVVLTNT